MPKPKKEKGDKGGKWFNAFKNISTESELNKLPKGTIYYMKKEGLGNNEKVELVKTKSGDMIWGIRLEDNPNKVRPVDAKKILENIKLRNKLGDFAQENKRGKKSGTENFDLQGSKECEYALKEYPDYKVFYRAGYKMRGAEEHELDRKSKNFEKEMKNNYKWAAATSIKIDHDKKEIHFNGFSENDLY